VIAMFACLDVHYTGSLAHAAMIVFQNWDDQHPICQFEAVSTVEGEYAPGELYKRELGPLLKVLSLNRQSIETLIIDGYCILSEDGRPGLGAHLYSALDERGRIIGVAKTQFRSAPAVRILRGASARPLYVTALGMPVQEAADGVVRMHGNFRLPTLLRAVDALARACPEETVSGKKLA
jgi:deoxyribonuclease V